MESSELPVNSPLDHEFADRNGRSAGNAGDSLAAVEKRDKGEPIILEPGVRHDDWRITHPGLAAGSGEDGAPLLTGEELQNGISSGPTLEDFHAHSGQSNSSTRQFVQDQSTVLPPKSSSPVKAAPAPPSPPPLHTLPPASGLPKRRVRELRLDLRSLDAAALFTLESWRREILGMEKLDMEHPDSVWYKSAEPTPPPSPTPQPKRNPGRPRRSAGRSLGRPQKYPLNASTEPEIVELDRAEYESLAQALGQAESFPTELDTSEEPVTQHATIQHALAEPKDEQPRDTSEAHVVIHNTDQPDLPQVIEQLEPDAGEDEPLRSEAQQSYSEEGESERSPSPDVILHDLYDENPEADPDFEPPKEPTPKKLTAMESDSGVIKLKKNGEPAKKAGRKSLLSRLYGESGIPPVSSSDIGQADDTALPAKADLTAVVEPKKRRRRTVIAFVELPSRRRSSSRQSSVIESHPQLFTSPYKHVDFLPPDSPVLPLFEPEEGKVESEDEWDEFRDI